LQKASIGNVKLQVISTLWILIGAVGSVSSLIFEEAEDFSQSYIEVIPEEQQ
jgi:hypothetical protein